MMSQSNVNWLDFAKAIHEGSIKFGLCSQEEIVAKLRELADRIERDERPKIALQESLLAIETKQDDFTITTLTLRFAELSPRASAGTKLFGNGAHAPVEVA